MNDVTTTQEAPRGAERSCCGTARHDGGGAQTRSSSSSRRAGLDDVRHVCPMCPDVESVGPSLCPSCGMALEPAAPSLDERPNPELVEMTRRLWVAGPAAALLVIAEMSAHVGAPAFPPGWTTLWATAGLATVVAAAAGPVVFGRAISSLANRRANMWTLLGLGTGAALVASAVAVATAAANAASAPPHVFFEAAGAILALTLLGQVLELRARARVGDAVRALLSLAPETAIRIGIDGDETVAASALRVGDRLRVRPGDRAPVDGVVRRGETAFDESFLTGEAVPVAKAVGDPVSAGAVNGFGVVEMEATRVGSETVLARIAEQVAAAQRSRAPVQAAVDRVAAWFTPAVVLLAFAALVGWLVVGAGWSQALSASIGVLVIACPCALGLATPMSVMVAIGRGAQVGVLARDAAALERLASVDLAVLDKTGTITEGAPRLVDVAAAPGARVDEDGLLAAAAALEANAAHPLAAAIRREAAQRGLDASARVEDFESALGRGVRGRIGDRAMAIGDAAWMAENGAEADGLARWAATHRADGAVALFAAQDGVLVAGLAFADPVRDDASATLAALRALGVDAAIASGDHPDTVRAIAERLDVARAEGALAPSDKAERVAEAQRAGRVVAMLGDGVNDAPALATADVGVAMGAGADAAIETAGIALIGGDFAGFLRARRLATALRANIRRGLVFAFGYNALATPLAAFGVLSPTIAAAAMALSSVSVIANALALRRARL